MAERSIKLPASRFEMLARRLVPGVLAATLAFAVPVHAKLFQIAPMDLGSGYTLTGGIQTDGTVGALTAANITNWNLNVTAISDLVYTPANTGAYFAQVTSNGSQLLVSASPDGVADGGFLGFSAGPRNQVRIADFTGAFINGGEAFYVKGAAFDFLPLHVADGANYVAANVNATGSNVFDLVRRKFPGGTVMSGTVTTDGSLGAVSFVDWNIIIRETRTWRFNPANSSVFNDFGLATDGVKLTVTPLDVDGNSGAFSIGAFNGYDFNGVLLGDYSWDPTGVAGLVTPFDLQLASGLPLDGNDNFVVGTAGVPEPKSWAMMLTGFAGIGLGLRRGRHRGTSHFSNTRLTEGL